MRPLSPKRRRVHALLVRYVNELKQLVPKSRAPLVLSSVCGFVQGRYTFRMLHLFMVRYVDDPEAACRLSKEFASAVRICVRAPPDDLADACQVCLSFKATDVCTRCRKAVIVCSGCEDVCSACRACEDVCHACAPA